MKLKLAALGLGLIVVTTITLAPGCTQSPGCFIEDQVVTMASAVVVKELECGSPDAVNADLHGIIGKIGLCGRPMTTGPIADAFCPILTSQVVDALASKAIPAQWGCNPNQAAGKLSAVLLEACRKIPVFAPEKK